MSLYKIGASPQLALSTVGATTTEQWSKPKVAVGIAATLLLFVGIWSLQRPAKPARRSGPDVSDIEERYRARGINPRKVFG